MTVLSAAPPPDASLSAIPVERSSRPTMPPVGQTAAQMQANQPTQPHPPWVQGDIFATVGMAAAHGVKIAVGELSKPDPTGGPSRLGVKVALYLGITGNVLALVAIGLVLTHQVMGNRVLEEDQRGLKADLAAIERQNTESNAALGLRMTTIEHTQRSQGEALAKISSGLEGIGRSLGWLVRVEEARARGEKTPPAPLPFTVAP